MRNVEIGVSGHLAQPLHLEEKELYWAVAGQSFLDQLGPVFNNELFAPFLEKIVEVGRRKDGELQEVVISTGLEGYRLCVACDNVGIFLALEKNRFIGGREGEEIAIATSPWLAREYNETKMLSYRYAKYVNRKSELIQCGNILDCSGFSALDEIQLFINPLWKQFATIIQSGR